MTSPPAEPPLPVTQSDPQVPAGRLVAGGIVFVVGFLSPLCLPLVARTGLTLGWQTALSGLLVLGIPELFAVIAASILGKRGFEYLKGRIKGVFGRFFREHGPAETVSRTRYRVGLVMFTVPVVLGWIAPYALHHFPAYEQHRLLYGLSGDVLLVLSLFVLGGEFWDKLRSLFVRGATARFPGR